MHRHANTSKTESKIDQPTRDKAIISTVNVR